MLRDVSTDSYLIESAIRFLTSATVWEHDKRVFSSRSFFDTASAKNRVMAAMGTSLVQTRDACKVSAPSIYKPHSREQQQKQGPTSYLRYFARYVTSSSKSPCGRQHTLLWSKRVMPVRLVRALYISPTAASSKRNKDRRHACGISQVRGTIY
jgi:Tfp pilus assembly protein PilV